MSMLEWNPVVLKRSHATDQKFHFRNYNSICCCQYFIPIHWRFLEINWKEVRGHSWGTAKYSPVSWYLRFALHSSFIDTFPRESRNSSIPKLSLGASINISSFVLFTFLRWHGSSCLNEIHDETSEYGKMARTAISVERPNLKRYWLCYIYRGT